MNTYAKCGPHVTGRSKDKASSAIALWTTILNKRIESISSRPDSFDPSYQPNGENMPELPIQGLDLHMVIFGENLGFLYLYCYAEVAAAMGTIVAMIKELYSSDVLR